MKFARENPKGILQVKGASFKQGIAPGGTRHQQTLIIFSTNN